MLAAVLAAPPATGQTRNVILLDAGAPGRPLGVEISQAFRDRLAERFREPVSSYYEGLDLDRFPDANYAASLRDFLGEKYRQHPPDVIAAIGDPAVRFALEWRRERWPEVPIVFAATSDRTGQEARQAGAATGVTARFDVAGGIRAALALLPQTEEVVLVAGGDPYAEAVEQALIAALGDRARVTRLVDLPLDETRRRLAALPDTALIFYSQITLDPAGQGFFGREALDQLAPVANRPIFGFFGTYLGHGIVGGSLLDPSVVGQELAAAVERLLAGTPSAAIPVVESGSNRLLFDDRQLRRWRLDPARLPPASEVRFRERSLIEEYRGTLLGIAALLLVQAGLIVALLLEVRRRRAAQRQLQRLSARILTAQEEERRRIARELHDAAGQQLALFAIELDQLGTASAPPRDATAEARALAERARSLSGELHEIARELHPAVLDHLGLVPALRQFGDQFAARHGIAVEVGAVDWPADLPDDVALALYRVAQEALQNVARHSGAYEARLSLRGSSNGLTLVVADRGRGFDAARATDRASLGLESMRERLRLVGGELCVDAAIGGGTAVTAAVPGRALARTRNRPASDASGDTERHDGQAARPAR